MKSFLARIRAFFGRLFGREVLPGRFESGSKGSWHGWLASAPLVAPRREYLVYIPRGHRRRAPLLVLCHGCRQSPEEIAAATRVTQFADSKGWLVLLPRQKDGANAWGCWNWFDVRTARGLGEAAILLTQLDAVQRRYRGDPRRVIVAGMSAGGAMAAALAVQHAERVSGLFVHSGLACGAASAPLAAMGVMKRGPDTDIEALARDVRQRWPAPRIVPVCVVHGADDDVVAPVNATALVRQFLALNAHPSLGRPGFEGATRWDVPDPDRETRDEPTPGRVVTTRDWLVEGRLVARLVVVASLQHAWSGGDGTYAYSDARPPAALDILARFAAEVAA